MNGQLYQLCYITAAAKKAIKENNGISYTALQYENKIEFQFLPEKKLFSTKKYKAENVQAWYDNCIKIGVRDFKLLAPITVKNRSILGYSNTTQSSIVCFKEGGNVTYFSAQWEFDSILKMWNILYTEQEWKNAPVGKPYFENNTESFKSVLFDIEDLARKIDGNSFGDLFQRALKILLGFEYIDNEKIPFPVIPEENLCLFKAAYTADVFGAMGSWNDSPPFMAHEKGLDKEYESLSNELLKQVRLATLYAINEW